MAPVSVEVQTALLDFVVAATPNVFTSEVTHVNQTTDGTQANVTMVMAMTEVSGKFSAQVSDTPVVQRLLQRLPSFEWLHGMKFESVRLCICAAPQTSPHILPT